MLDRNSPSGNENTDREKQMGLKNVQKTKRTIVGEEEEMRYRNKINCHEQLECMSSELFQS